MPLLSHEHMMYFGSLDGLHQHNVRCNRVKLSLQTLSGTGMVASMVLFAPHLGSVTKDLSRLLLAVLLCM